VYPSLSPEVGAAVRAFVVALPQLTDQGDANAWARVLAAVSIDEWAGDEVAALLGRTGDNWELADAIKVIGVQKDPAWRAANDEVLRAGSLEALQWVGPITAVPPDAVGAVVAAAGNAIREKVADARNGLYSFGARVEPGRVLVLANTAFPAVADWAPVLDLLTEPRANYDMLDGALLAIEHRAHDIPADVRGPLAAALAGIARRPGPRSRAIDRGDPRSAAQAALDAVDPEAVSGADWTTIRDWRGRRRMCLSLARRKDPADANVLTTLAGDPDPRVRAAAAQALSYWLSQDVAADRALDVLKRVVVDDGTYVARRIVSEWPDPQEPRLRPLAEILADHLSAEVRAAAARMLGGRGQRGE
jgi:hypothetical protein